MLPWNPWRFFELFALQIMVITVAVLLLFFVPVLRLGWWMVIFTIPVNVAMLPVSVGMTSTIFLVQLSGLLFILILVLLLPRWAQLEERQYRYGYDSWGMISIQSLKFGLVHCLYMGVPLGVGLALSLGGLYFGYKYKRALERNLVTKRYRTARHLAMLESAKYHAWYNIMLAFYAAMFLIGNLLTHDEDD